MVKYTYTCPISAIHPRTHRSSTAMCICVHPPLEYPKLLLCLCTMHTQSSDGASPHNPSPPVSPPSFLLHLLSFPFSPKLRCCFSSLPACILFINGNAWSTGNLKGYFLSLSQNARELPWVLCRIHIVGDAPTCRGLSTRE